MNTMSSKSINDPIYGAVDVDETMMLLVNAPEFQRLHHIKQLSFAYEVYPGATHTRFEHSTGTMHLVKEFLKRLQEIGPEFGSRKLKQLKKLAEKTQFSKEELKKSKTWTKLEAY